MNIIYTLTHLPELLLGLFSLIGNWGYVLLFLMIFAETGLVVFPWLPGESLIFFASSFAAFDHSPLEMRVLIPVFFVAAVLGDSLNYYIGRRLVRWSWLRQRIEGPNLEKARQFFNRYGLVAVTFGRFVPLIRTFVPLISGSADLSWHRFSLANLLGVAIWVALGSGVGYFFGGIPFVKKHFSVIFLGIIIIALIPVTILLITRSLRRHVIKRNKMM
ncbi:VTT domain-containing protein [Limosilactobacillus difficilis]|uniref:VTT domain-containing protein n=1 Tax=Limosilactobacillus difficilis TaxID=2991838 RepID=UPI0024BA10AB|nr:VTT domain-containing protein [Limosilactobacillus difficilis]